MKKNNNTISWTGIACSAIAVFLGVSFFVWTLVPYMQMNRYVRMLKTVSGLQKIALEEKVFAPYTSVQPEIRNSFLNRLTENFTKELVDHTLVLSAVEKLEQAVEKEPDVPKYYFSLARAYTALAIKNPEQREEYFRRAEEYCYRAYSLLVNSPEAAQVYAVVLINQGKYGEVITLLEESLKVVPDAPQSHYYLGVALFHSEEALYGRALEELELSNPNAENAATVTLYKKLFAFFYQKKDIARFATVVGRLEEIDPVRAGLYGQIGAHISEHGTIPLLDIR